MTAYYSPQARFAPATEPPHSILPVLQPPLTIMFRRARPTTCASIKKPVSHSATFLMGEGRRGGTAARPDLCIGRGYLWRGNMGRREPAPPILGTPANPPFGDPLDPSHASLLLLLFYLTARMLLLLWDSGRGRKTPGRNSPLYKALREHKFLYDLAPQSTN